jgi:hypothetical protein
MIVPHDQFSRQGFGGISIHGGTSSPKDTAYVRVNIGDGASINVVNTRFASAVDFQKRVLYAAPAAAAALFGGGGRLDLIVVAIIAVVILVVRATGGGEHGVPQPGQEHIFDYIICG